MVIKFKVSDVAKDFGKNNKDIINILSEYCDGPAKKANTVLEEKYGYRFYKNSHYIFSVYDVGSSYGEKTGR